MGKLNRLSDSIKESVFKDTEPIALQNILNKDIVIQDVKILKGIYREFAVIKFNFYGKDKLFSTVNGGKVVVRKLKEAQAKKVFPVIATITQPAQYFDIE